MSSLFNQPPSEEPQPLTQGAGENMSVQAMFQHIIGALHKSDQDISELRQNYHELKVVNANLERQIRENLHQTHLHARTAPSSPALRHSSSSFMVPTGIAPLSVPPPTDQAFLTRHEIPGFWAVVPAGGAGTRLWPLSREGHPKFLLDLTLKGRSLIQSTWDRLLPLTGAERLMVVTGRSHTAGVTEQLSDLLPPNLLSEPSPKESAAAIGLAAAVLAQRDPEAILGSFAADHMISGHEAFLTAVAEAVETARHNLLVTIGIAPSYPATGFGYIRLGASLKFADAPNARRVSQFKEKPDGRTAAAYLATGSYRWNGGMFVVKAKFLLELLAEYEPELYEGLQTIANAWNDEGKRNQVLDEVWPTLPKIAIDNAVAEPAAGEGKVAVVPATFGWDDVGDFGSLAELIPAEPGQARVLGESNLVVTEKVAGGIIVPASGRRIACLGVDDLVIVDTPDALLVTTRARSQEVKKIVAKCRENGWKDIL